MIRPLQAAATILLILVAIGTASVSAEENTAKRADIRRLLELTDGLAMGQQVMDRLFQIQREANASVPEEVWQEIRDQLDASSFEPAVVEIWDRHFSHEEILALIDFYRSPLGRKLVETQPSMVEESMAAGQAWAAQVIQRIRARLRQRGYST